jgi:hypothetical protein
MLLQNAQVISDQPFNINLSLDMFFKEAEYKFISEEIITLDTSETPILQSHTGCQSINSEGC